MMPPSPETQTTGHRTGQLGADGCGQTEAHRAQPTEVRWWRGSKSCQCWATHIWCWPTSHATSASGPTASDGCRRIGGRRFRRLRRTTRTGLPCGTSSAPGLRPVGGSGQCREGPRQITEHADVRLPSCRPRQCRGAPPGRGEQRSTARSPGHRTGHPRRGAGPIPGRHSWPP